MNAIATENYSTVSTMQKDMKHYFTSLIEETKQKAPNGKVTDAVWRAVLEKAQLH